MNLSRKCRTPLGAVACGVAAGVIGTATMTAWQTAAAKLFSSGSDQDSGDEGLRDPWKDAPAPAQVAQRVLDGVFHRPAPPQRIPLITNVMHWSYGSAWGIAYGLVAGTTGRSRPRDGLIFGAAVWSASYLQLVPMGIYEPPWKYKPQELALDLSYHLAYGIGVSTGYKLLDRL